MKTFYIAARARYRQDEVSNIQKQLESRGWKNLFNWVEAGKEGRVTKPYRDNPEGSYSVGNDMLNAAYSSDLFILLHEEELEGALMEYGAARYALINNDRKKIVIVELGKRDSVFVNGGGILRLNSIEELNDWIETV